MTDLEKKNLEELADRELEKLDLKRNTSRLGEVCIVYCDRNQFSLTEFQYFYDYIKQKNIFPKIIVLPSGSYIETMSLDELKLWAELIPKRVEELINE